MFHSKQKKRKISVWSEKSVNFVIFSEWFLTIFAVFRFVLSATSNSQTSNTTTTDTTTRQENRKTQTIKICLPCNRLQTGCWGWWGKQLQGSWEDAGWTRTISETFSFTETKPSQVLSTRLAGFSCGLVRVSQRVRGRGPCVHWLQQGGGGYTVAEDWITERGGGRVDDIFLALTSKVLLSTWPFLWYIY